MWSWGIYLEESGGPLSLLLFSVDTHHRQVDVVEQLVVELDRHAGGEEHHHLHILIRQLANTKLITFLFLFFLRKVKSKRNLFSEGQMT